MTEHNPYRAPESEIAVDIAGGERYQPKIFTTHGRIGRMRYWVYSMLATLLLYLVVGIGFAALAMAGSGLDPNAGAYGLGPIGMLLYAITIAFGLAITFVYAVRRLNDLNRSGWISLVMLVPLVNLVLYLYLLFAKGNQGTNQYGPQPVPNSTGVKVGFALSLILPVLVLIAIAVPAYQGYAEQAQLQGFELPAE